MLFGRVDLTTGNLTTLFEFPRNLYDGLYYQSASAGDHYSWFANKIEGLVLADVTVSKRTFTASPPAVVWSEQHQPLGIQFDPASNTYYSVAYWESSQPKPRQLFSVDAKTWAVTDWYTWPAGSPTNFLELVFDAQSKVVHMGLTDANGTFYIQSVDLATNTSTLVNLTNVSPDDNVPSSWVWNADESQVWALLLYANSQTGLVRVDPKTGIVSAAATATFGSASWGYGGPSAIIDPDTGLLFGVFTVNDSNILVGVNASGSLVSQVPLLHVGSIGAISSSQ